MPLLRTVVRAALVRALFLSIAGTATPALACPGPSLATLAAGLPAASRHDLGAAPLPALLPLWTAHQSEPLPVPPDAITVFGLDGQVLAIAYLRADCLVGLLPVPATELWRSLFLRIGPIA